MIVISFFAELVLEVEVVLVLVLEVILEVVLVLEVVLALVLYVVTNLRGGWRFLGRVWRVSMSM